MKVALIQSSFSVDAKENLDKVIHYMENAAQKGAQVVLAPELFLGPYFCKNQDEQHFSLALKSDNKFVNELSKVCRQFGLVFPFSFFEKSGPNYFNSVVMIDADGTTLGLYRKTHIPDGAGYQEKFYFRPGNTGFKVFTTRYGNIGCGICWDQWFSEAARIMTLKGAELLLYPTAIGSEPLDDTLDTLKPWQRVMVGHAVCNMIPIAAANRIGNEDGQVFYGNSFICDEFGETIANLHNEDGVVITHVDIERANNRRNSFGFFRDRRVDVYDELIK